MRRETDKLLRTMREEEMRRQADVRRLEALWHTERKEYERVRGRMKALRAKLADFGKPEPTLHEMLADIDTP